VGTTLPITWDKLAAGFLGPDKDSGDAAVRESLTAVREMDSPVKRSVLAEAVESESGIIGCIELGSTQTNFFLDKDKEILSRFLPYLSWCLLCIRTQPGGHNE
jgi:hypothetical protein